jgi:hypothetical protein
MKIYYLLNQLELNQEKYQNKYYVMTEDHEELLQPTEELKHYYNQYHLVYQDNIHSNRHNDLIHIDI